MELKIVIENENPLFNRREIEGEIRAETIPSRPEVRKLLAEKYSVSEDTIKIRTIKGAYGSKVFLLVANIYKSKEDKDGVERAKKKDIQVEKKSNEVKEEKVEADVTGDEKVVNGKTQTDDSVTDAQESKQNGEITTEEKPAEENKEEAK